LVPQSPKDPDPLRNAFGALLLGLLLGPEARSRDVFTFHRPGELVRLARLEGQISVLVEVTKHGSL